MIKVKVIEENMLKVNVGEIANIGTGGKTVQIGSGLKLEDNVLSVDTTDKVEEDNTKPVTSGAVFNALSDNDFITSNELSSAVESALQTAKESGEFDGPKGDTPQKGVDYFTEDDINAIAAEAAERVDVPECGTTDYTQLENKPKINGVELDGDKTADDLGISAGKEWRYLRKVTIPEDITTDTSGVTWAAKEYGDVTFAFDTDKNGKPFEYREVMVTFEAATNFTQAQLSISNDVTPIYNGTKIAFPSIVGINGAKKIGHGQTIDYGVVYTVFGVANTGTLFSQPQLSRIPISNPMGDSGKWTAINCFLNNYKEYGFSVGSTFEFYVR